MQGQHGFQPKLFSVVNLESFVPKNHLLRRVDQVLDLAFVREITAPFYSAKMGRPSIDPEIFVRMLLVQYLYGIESDRQLCEELGYNLVYRWFCKYSLEDDTPDHSSMTKIRDRIGEQTFRKLFQRVVGLCKEKGLVRGEKVMMDGTLVHANAALNSLAPKEGVEQEGKSASPNDFKWKKKIRGKKISNQTHTSNSDPDARLAGKEGSQKYLAYKVHNTIERDSRVVIDTHVTDGATLEGKVMFRRVDKIEEELGVKIQELTADRGYGYGENLAELSKRAISSNVPNFHSQVGATISSELYTFDKENNWYVCKAGEKLLPFNKRSKKPEDFAVVYAIRGKQCFTCSYQSRCFPDGPSKNLRKHLSRNIFTEFQAETKEKEQNDKQFKKALYERMWKIEGIFSEAKNLHGLNRAKYRGRPKMQIQAYMTATVQNIKRLIAASVGDLGVFFRKICQFMDIPIFSEKTAFFVLFAVI